MMKTTTIKTADELLALRDKGGVIRIDHNLEIECDVPWNVGRNIAGIVVYGDLYCRGGLYCRGDLDCRGDLYCRGYLNCRGDLDCRGYLDCGGFLDCRGDLDCGGNLDCRGYLNCGGNLDCRGYLDCGGFLDCRGFLNCGGSLYCGGYLYCRGYLNCGGDLNCEGDYLVVTGDFFWSHASMPYLPEKHYIKRVLPQDWQCAHWQERLGMDISNGCYDEICEKVLSEINNLLKDDRWSLTERWMLETLKASTQDAPEWVERVRKDRESA